MWPSKHWNKKQNKWWQIKKNKPLASLKYFFLIFDNPKMTSFFFFWAVSYTISRIFRLFKTSSQWGELDTALGSFRRPTFSSWTNDGYVFSSWLSNLNPKLGWHLLTSIDKICYRRLRKVNWPFLRLKSSKTKQYL